MQKLSELSKMCHVQILCRCSGSAGPDQCQLNLSKPRTGSIHIRPIRVDTIASTCVMRTLNESARQSSGSSGKMGTHTHTHSPLRKLCGPIKREVRDIFACTTSTRERTSYIFRYIVRLHLLVLTPGDLAHEKACLVKRILCKSLPASPQQKNCLP